MKTADLRKTLELVKPALAGNDLVPIFQSFAFTKTSVIAYNDSIGISAPCKTGQPPFAVNGNILLGLLTNSQADEVTFSLKPAEHQVLMLADGMTTKLPYQEEGDFLFEEPKNTWDIKRDLSATFLGGLESCLATTSKNEDQTKLMGVAIQAKGNDATLYSCDGDAVTRLKIGKGATANQLTLTNAFCEALIRLHDGNTEGGGTLHVNSEWAFANLNTGYKLYGRMPKIDDPFDYDGLIKRTLKGTQKPIKAPTGLSEALGRARVLADLETAKTTLTVTAGKLSLFTDTHMGTVKDLLKIKGHEDAEAKVSAALIQAALKQCDEMAIFDNCTMFQSGTELLIVVSNMD